MTDASVADTGTPDRACPDQEPPLNSSCEQPGTRCTYGDIWWPRCRGWWDCEFESATENKWHLYYGSEERECDEPLGPSCPAQPPTEPTACPSTAVGCFYEDTGTLCDCRQCCNEAGCYRCMGLPDGSLRWKCDVPRDPQCPKLRPNLGAPCDLPEGTVCYGDLCDREISCTGGVWIRGPFVTCDEQG
jgi:hypothetical protein